MLFKEMLRPLSLHDYPSPAWTVRGTPKDSKDVKPLFYHVTKICDSVSFRTPIPVLSKTSNSDDLHKRIETEEKAMREGK